MATDPAETLIRDVHAKLEQYEGRDVALGIDDRAVWENNAPPRLVWVYYDGDIDNSTNTGGAEGSSAADLARFDVHVWGEDHGDARQLFHSLWNALRFEAFPPNVRLPQGYRWLRAENMHEGAVLIARVQMSLPVKVPVQQTAIVIKEHHQCSVNDEVVHNHLT